MIPVSKGSSLLSYQSMDGGNGVIDLPLYKLDNIAIGLHVEMSEVSVNRA